MLELGPILKTLWRNRIAPLLIILQLALSIAVISNALYFIQERTEKINRPSGVAEDEIVRIWMRRNDPAVSFESVVERDMALIRSMPGVVNATPATAVPFSGRGARSIFSTAPGKDQEPIFSAYMFLDSHGLNTLGVRLLEGREFTENEMSYFDPTSPPTTSSTIISQSLAEALYPEESAVGKAIYFAGALELTVVGVTEQMMGPWPHTEDAGHVVLIPKIQTGDAMDYLIRTDGRAPRTVLMEVLDKLREADQGRLVADEKTLKDIKAEAYAGDKAMVTILTLVVFMLAFVNALGILGMTSFWVNQRRRQIGIRRALGADRLAIMRYFFLENVLLVLIATLLGGTAAIVVSSYLVQHYGFSFMPWPFIVITGLLTLVITLLAAYQPVRRASLISPVEAVASI